MSARAEEFLDASQVADMFEVDRHTVWRWANAGRLPYAMTPSGRRRYPAEEIRALVAKSRIVVGPVKVRPSQPLSVVEVGDWINLDGDAERADDINEDGTGSLVFTFASGRVETLPSDYPVEILRTSGTPSVGGGN